jgi:hypothetical protein
VQNDEHQTSTLTEICPSATPQISHGPALERTWAFEDTVNKMLVTQC